MNNVAPIQEQFGESWTPGWAAWFKQVFLCLPWKQAFNYKFTIDFANIPANSESAGTAVTIPGARPGDAVHVTPFSNTVGITYKGVVSAADTVTLYAINFTAGAVNPASMLYRVIVTQN